MREPINRVDYKMCRSCGDDLPLSTFIDRNNYEQPYCSECRTKCVVCGDWVGECQGVHEEEAA